MTLRDLLEQVERLGGPVKVDANLVYLWGGEWGWLLEGGRDSDAELRDHALVGVLKRDLIERGVRGASHWYQHEEKLVWSVDLYNEKLIRFAEAYQKSSELEAILKAWLAAAQAEGWGKQ